MAVELARQPIKPVNAVQTWREQGDDGEGDNDDDNDDDIDDFVPKTGRLAPSNASSSCLVVIICSLLIIVDRCIAAFTNQHHVIQGWRNLLCGNSS